MAVIDSILNAGAGAVAGAVGNLAKDIRTAITGKEAITAEEREKILAATSQMEQLALQADQSIAAGQEKINEIEAASPSFWKSGARPAIMWVCAAGFAYNFLIRPLFPWMIVVLCHIGHFSIDIPPLPQIDVSELSTMLMGLLGLGGMRTFEKLKGVA